VLVKRTDVRRTAKVGYHQVTPAGATCFWQKTLAFYFSEFSKFLAFFWGESWGKLPASHLQLGTNLAPKPSVGVGVFRNGEVPSPMELQWVSIALLGS
jgi:hypothetical protein